MTKMPRRAVAAFSALVVLTGCGTASQDAQSDAPTGDVTPPSEVVGESTREPRTAESARSARVLSRSASRAAGSLDIAFDDVSVLARQPAVRLAPPVPEEIDDGTTAGIEQVWLDVAECESNQRWAYNGSSGYDGGLQFSPSSWRGVGGTDFAEYAWQATPREQVTVAERLLDVQGWGAWPTCARKLGLR